MSTSTVPANAAPGSSNPEKKSAIRPTTSEMVNDAIINLNDRRGSSIKAITKYMSQHYEINVENLMPYIKRYLKKSLSTGSIVNTTGTGLSGSFKLAKEAKVVTTNDKKTAVQRGGKSNKGGGDTKKMKTKKAVVPTLKVKASLLNGTLAKRKSIGFKIGKKVTKEKGTVAKKSIVIKSKSEMPSLKGKIPKQPKEKLLKAISESAVNKKVSKIKSNGAKSSKPKTTKSTKNS